jgi:hypothetical protein
MYELNYTVDNEHKDSLEYGEFLLPSRANLVLERDFTNGPRDTVLRFEDEDDAKYCYDSLIDLPGVISRCIFKSE